MDNENIDPWSHSEKSMHDHSTLHLCCKAEISQFSDFIPQCSGGGWGVLSHSISFALCCGSYQRKEAAVIKIIIIHISNNHTNITYESL